MATPEQVLEGLDFDLVCAVAGCNNRAAWVASCNGCPEMSPHMVCGPCRDRARRELQQRTDGYICGTCRTYHPRPLHLTIPWREL